MTAIRNFLESDLDDLPNCHDGNGVLKHIQLFVEQDFKSNLRFFNYTILPLGTSIELPSMAKMRKSTSSSKAADK